MWGDRSGVNGWVLAVGGDRVAASGRVERVRRYGYRRYVGALVLVLALGIAGCATVPPATESPTIESPVVDASTSDAAAAETPTTDTPTTEAPATDVLTTEGDVVGNKYEVTIWTVQGGYADKSTLLANADTVSEINPFWYTLGNDGSIQGRASEPETMAELRALGIRIVPTIANEFDRARVHRVISTAEGRTAHAQALVDLVLEHDFDGIDVDYESLFAEDRDDFSLFIEELADLLHAEGKLLSIAVHPKPDENVTWGGPLAQDYARLGAAVDEFKVMTYDYSWSTSPAGPISPVPWAKAVMEYATSLIPPEKVYMGVHFYGLDWQGSLGQSKVWAQIQALIERNEVEVERDESNEGTFSYGTSRPRTVYFADALSVETKLREVFGELPEMAGIAIWRLGGEDPAVWDVLREWAHR